MGHKFNDRNGITCTSCYVPEAKERECAPIFLQWIWAVYQVLNQFPAAFQFNEQLLHVLLEHTTSGRFGTFLGNSAKERAEKNIADNTFSFWEHITSDENIESYWSLYWLNNETTPSVSDTKDINSEVLRVNVQLDKLRIFDHQVNRRALDSQVVHNYVEAKRAVVDKDKEIASLRRDLHKLKEQLHNTSPDQLSMEIEEDTECILVDHWFVKGNVEKPYTKDPPPVPVDLVPNRQVTIGGTERGVIDAYFPCPPDDDEQNTPVNTPANTTLVCAVGTTNGYH